MTDREALESHDRLLASIGQKAEAIGARRLASHWPHVGKDYARSSSPSRRFRDGIRRSLAPGGPPPTLGQPKDAQRSANGHAPWA